MGSVFKISWRQAVAAGAFDVFAEENLFKPLGVTGVEWSFIQPDIVQASGSHYMRPRDVAKFGYLFINDGTWGGGQIIPQGWMDETVREYISYSIDGWSEHYGDRYGYQWWLKTYEYNSQSYEVILRSGWGCQKIVLFPEHDTMVILNGGYYTDRESVNEIVTEFILPALAQGS